jgi:hypothetical protein
LGPFFVGRFVFVSRFTQHASREWQNQESMGQHLSYPHRMPRGASHNVNSRAFSLVSKSF